MKLSNEWRTPQDLFDELNKEFNFDIDLCATKENSKCSDYCIDYLNDIMDEQSDIDATHTKGSFSEYIQFYSDVIAFCNPPYSNPKPFIEKAWEDSKHCKIVLLVKCDPSTQWWSIFWNHREVETKVICNICKGTGDAKFSNGTSSGACFHCKSTGYKILYEMDGEKPGCEVRFFPKRIKFDPPQQMVDSGEVELINGKWHKVIKYAGMMQVEITEYVKLSGPTFPCALLVFDRRGL